MKWSDESEGMLASETLFSLGEIVHKLPIQRHHSTLRRWATRGVRAEDGTVVVLETVTIAGRRHTSVEAYKRFIAALVEHGGAGI